MLADLALLRHHDIRPVSSPLQAKKKKGVGKERSPVERRRWMLGKSSEKSGIMATRLIEVVKDGGGLLGDGGEEGGGINRKVLARRQGKGAGLEH